MRLCSIPDCPNRHASRGLCDKHYRRWLRHGNPTQALPVGGSVSILRRQPMDDWEKSRVSKMIERGMSTRDIQRSTGINHMTVWRFARSAGLGSRKVAS